MTEIVPAKVGNPGAIHKTEEKVQNLNHNQAIRVGQYSVQINMLLPDSRLF